MQTAEQRLHTTVAELVAVEIKAAQLRLRRDAAMAELRAAGMSDRAIGRLCGMSPMGVGNRLRRMA